METAYRARIIETPKMQSLTDIPVVSPNETIALLVQELLSLLGEDPSREGLKRTPERVSRMYQELLAGYQTDLDTLVNEAIFETDYQDMVLVRDVQFFSLCEHHMLPFFGRAHVAYLPDGKIIGLSKIPRLVDMFSRRLQVQERMTQQIADTLHEILHPRGIAVAVEGTHFCAVMRGIKKSEARMVTCVTMGAFRRDATLRQDFYNQLRLHSHVPDDTGSIGLD